MDEQAKKTFILYADQWEAIKNLSDPKLGRLFRCLYRYILGELDMSEVKADIYTAFMFLKTQIDIYKTKYEKRIEKSKKGAAARWEKKVKNVKKCPSMPKHA